MATTTPTQSAAASGRAPRKAAPAGQRVRGLGGSRGRTLNFWLFTGPFLIGLIVFVYVPIGWSLWLSLYNAKGTVAPTEFVGLGNYADMLGDGDFVDSLVNFTIFAAIIVPITYALSLALALLVHRIRFMKAFFRSVFFLPTACSFVVASLVWKMSMFNGLRYGMVNTVLDMFGIDSVAWLASPHPPWYWLVICTARLWLQCGFYMILFLAALQNIPRELYEAAAVDGAKSGWQTFRHITLPQLRATSVAVVLLLLIAAYQAFDEFYNILDEGRATWGRPPLVELYLQALGANQDYGHASAGALILALLIAMVTLAQGKFLGFGRGDAT